MLMFLSILSGILAAPLGSILAILVVYGVLIVSGKSEDQGRRGLCAGATGLVPGALVGFSVGMTLAKVGPGYPLAWLAHLAAALLGAVAVGLIGLILCAYRGPSCGTGNRAGGTANCGFFYIVIPLALANGTGLFAALHLLHH